MVFVLEPGDAVIAVEFDRIHHRRRQPDAAVGRLGLAGDNLLRLHT